MKRCSMCKLEKPVSEFHKNAAMKDGLQGKCKLCVKDYNSKYDYTVRDKVRWASFQLEMDLIKSVPCMDCGNTFPPECMDFDHRPDEIKVSEISGMMTHRRERILEEIAKCDIICANCHRIRTKKRRAVCI